MHAELAKLEGFEWDDGNLNKSLQKHGVTRLETEEAFFRFYLVFPDLGHSKDESRFAMYGQTKTDKILFIAFAIRNGRVRIISARPANKKERITYEEASKKTT